MIRRIDMYSTIGRAMRRKTDAAVRYFVKNAPDTTQADSRFSPSRMQAAMQGSQV